MSRGIEHRALDGFGVEFEFEYGLLHSLLDRVHPSTRSNNASECDVTFELYCIVEPMYYDHLGTN